MVLLTREKVWELFLYEPSTGWLIRRVVAGNAKRGDIVGSAGSKGYLRVSIGGYRYRNHRVVWLYHYGWLPEIIDHINRNKTDNRIENLRPATNSQNCINRNKNINGSNKFRGVTKSGNKYRAQGTFNGNRVHVGTFSTEEEASDAFNRFMEERHGEYFTS